jgi:hypothetical protein
VSLILLIITALVLIVPGLLRARQRARRH